MYQWQIYCNPEGIMVPKWSDTILTQCPNNPAHSVVLNSAAIIQSARFTQKISSLFTTSSTSYVNVGKFVFQGTNYYNNDHVPVKYIKIRASIPSGSYDLRLIDPSSTVLWSSTGITGTSDVTTTIDFDTFTNPTNEVLLTLQTKTSGSTVTISDVSIYAAMSPE